MIQPTNMAGPRLKAIWRDMHNRRAAGTSKATITTLLAGASYGLSSAEQTAILANIDA